MIIQQGIWIIDIRIKTIRNSIDISVLKAKETYYFYYINFYLLKAKLQWYEDSF